MWDGGRIFSSYTQATKEEVTDILYTYNHVFNIPARFIFTNCCLEEKDYHNRFGNLLMEWGSYGPNEVVLADDNFMRYLKEKFPSYRYISSTTKCLTSPEKARAELNREEYDLVCLDYNLNANLKFLSDLTPEEKAKTELLVNAICSPACQNRKNHYFKNSQSHLNYGRPYHMEYCNIQGMGSSEKKHHLTYDLIREKYEPLGLTHFKLEGRTWDDIDLIIALCNYMVKPEHRSTVLIAMSERMRL